MAGVLERVRWSQKRLAVGHGFSYPKVDRKIQELQTAKEILAEIFDVRISDVEEMIQCRFDEASCGENSYEEEVLWPREFTLGE